MRRKRPQRPSRLHHGLSSNYVSETTQSWSARWMQRRYQEGASARHPGAGGAIVRSMGKL